MGEKWNNAIIHFSLFNFHLIYSGIPLDSQQLMESRRLCRNAPAGGMSAWALNARSRKVVSLLLTKLSNLSCVEKSAPLGAVLPL